MEELKLIPPEMAYAEQIAAFRAEYLAAGSTMDGCGALRHASDPAAFIRACEALRRGEDLPAEKVPATQLMLIRAADDRLLGMLQIRHYFNEYLREYGGHIGYTVRPAERRKGYAKRMLALALPVCRELGLRRVLITCLEENTGSERTIRANGGIYQNTVFDPEAKRFLKRFWIAL